MGHPRRIGAGIGASLLALGLFLSGLLLAESRMLASPVIQALSAVLSIGLLFYLSHPMGHFLVARALGVRTSYFYLGKSGFRRLPLKGLAPLGRLLPTLGTKLRREELSRLSPRRRGYIFGAGAILSTVVVGAGLLYVVSAGFMLPAVLLSFLLFVVTLATEFLLSTRVGDLRKMADELRSGGASPPTLP